MRPYERTGILLGVIILVTVILVRVAAGAGAPIPVDPHYIVMEYRLSQNPRCLPTVLRNTYYCDRVFAGSFQ